MKIGLLSDTHGWLDPDILDYFGNCDEIWHAGDIGNMDLVEQIEEVKPFRAVYGNIDDYTIRTAFPEDLTFQCEDVKVLMTHIGGYPGRYTARVKELIKRTQPKLYICGHSHILKIMYDQINQCLHVNPGACGHHGFHQVRTIVRFEITKDRIHDMEYIELGRRGQILGSE